MPKDFYFKKDFTHGIIIPELDNKKFNKQNKASVFIDNPYKISTNGSKHVPEKTVFGIKIPETIRLFYSEKGIPFYQLESKIIAMELDPLTTTSILNEIKIFKEKTFRKTRHRYNHFIDDIVYMINIQDIITQNNPLFKLSVETTFSDGDLNIQNSDLFKQLKKKYHKINFDMTIEEYLNINKKHFLEIPTELAFKIQNSLEDKSKYKKLDTEKFRALFQSKFIMALSLYRALMIQNRKEEFIIFKNNKLNDYILYELVKQFKIQEILINNLSIYIYQALINILKEHKINIGNNGILIKKGQDITLTINETSKYVKSNKPHNLKPLN